MKFSWNKAPENVERKMAYDRDCTERHDSKQSQNDALEACKQADRGGSKLSILTKQ
jgi:hypothetical protein